MVSSRPGRLAPREFEKVWGSRQLEPWFPNPDRKIGEVWFAEAESPVLVKFLFTSENLSVQVHPDDAQARQDGSSRGKTEMWHILRAEPGARIALGLAEPVGESELRRAALSGRIMNMLNWIPVKPGDTWFVPAGAIHAIGSGIALCEIQQYSDVTYRLYDYGRGRELHLDQGLAVADVSFRAKRIEWNELYSAGKPRQLLVACPYFTVESIRLTETKKCAPQAGKRSLLIGVRGEGSLEGEHFRLGEVWTLPDSTVELTGDAQLLRVTY